MSGTIWARSVPGIGLPALSVGRQLDVDETGEVIVGRPAQLYGFHATNSGGAAAFLKFYDKATAADQNDTPVATYRIPATNGEVEQFFPVGGVHFTAGIGVRAVTTVADNGNTGAGTNEVVVNAYYR